MKGGIDETDRKILAMLSEDPKLSQAEISGRLGLSQPAISARVRRLEETGVLTHMIGADIKKAQLFLAKVEFSAENVEEVLEFLETCPLYLNCFLTSGRNNMSCLLIGENVRSIMSCVDSRLRKNLRIRNIAFDLIVTPSRPMVVPIKPHTERKKITPCGEDCSTCTLYLNERCLGCPSSIHYKGRLL